MARCQRNELIALTEEEHDQRPKNDDEAATPPSTWMNARRLIAPPTLEQGMYLLKLAKEKGRARGAHVRFGS